MDHEGQLEAVRKEVERLDAETKEQWRVIRRMRDDLVKNRYAVQGLADELHQYRQEAREDHKDLVSRLDNLTTSVHDSSEEYRTKIDQMSGGAKMLRIVVGGLISIIAAVAAWIAVVQDWAGKLFNTGAGQ